MVRVVKRRLLIGLAAYLFVLGWVASPWIRVADRAVPSNPLIAHPADARLNVTYVSWALRLLAELVGDF
jgi:hypothetical protein